jgi:hypothetical protein
MAKDSVRAVHLEADARAAAVLLDDAIAGSAADNVPDIQTLGRTLLRW